MLLESKFDIDVELVRDVEDAIVSCCLERTVSPARSDVVLATVMKLVNRDIARDWISPPQIYEAFQH